MQRAHKLVREYFWPHARAVLRLAGLSERHARAKRALRWIRAKRLKEVSVQDVRVDALGRTVDEADAKVVIDAPGQRLLAAAEGGKFCLTSRPTRPALGSEPSIAGNTRKAGKLYQRLRATTGKRPFRCCWYLRHTTGGSRAKRAAPPEGDALRPRPHP